MYNPAHPGEILKELVIGLLSLSITEATYHLGISRKIFSKMLNKHGSVTSEMALRFEITFGKPDAAHWPRLQNAYNLWKLDNTALIFALRLSKFVLLNR